MRKRYCFLLLVCSMILYLSLSGCVPPKPEPKVKQLSEMKGQIALLTLNPLPSSSASEVESLGFTALMPYSGIVSGWKGKLISIPDRSGVFLRFTADEPDCRKYNPYKELEKYKQMKAETPDIPVGFVLCYDLGCGWDSYVVDGKTITKEDWIKVAKEVDFITCGMYAWDSRFISNDIEALEYLEESYQKIIAAIEDVPFLPMLQAHWGYGQLIKPSIEAQVKFWKEKGYEGYIVYCWTDEYHGVRDTKEEWEKWNKWFLSQIK